MQTREKLSVKNFSIILSLAMVVIYFCCKPCNFYLYRDADWWHAITFSFMHGNLAHLFCNIWMFLTIVFYYRPKASLLVTTFITTVMFGYLITICYWGKPIVGMSAWLYCMLGRYGVTNNIRRDIRYNTIMVCTIALGTLLPNVSWIAHAICYYIGFVIGLLSEPFFKTK